MTKILIDKETAELALEALEVATTPLAKDRQEVLRAQAALRQAIAEAEQAQPVAVWELQESGWDTIADAEWMETLPIGTKLYTAPPQRKPLTDEEIVRIKQTMPGTLDVQFVVFARAIEAAHGIKE